MEDGSAPPNLPECCRRPLAPKVAPTPGNSDRFGSCLGQLQPNLAHVDRDSSSWAKVWPNLASVCRNLAQVLFELDQIRAKVGKQLARFDQTWPRWPNAGRPESTREFNCNRLICVCVCVGPCQSPIVLQADLSVSAEYLSCHVYGTGDVGSDVGTRIGDTHTMWQKLGAFCKNAACSKRWRLDSHL